MHAGAMKEPWLATNRRRYKMLVVFSHYGSVRFENWGLMVFLCIFVQTGKRMWCNKDVSKCPDPEKDLISHIGVTSP